ncbi:MAG TPA: glycosyltransferase family 4 protein [Chthoniobacteraceae bacterium]|nr:glycosyltransferase family 4 protein [Chthoniobacteraceae bacterium]
MKILVLCYEYPPIGGGGGRVAKTVAEALARRGHEVRVQTAALGLRSQHEQIDGVDVYRTASGRRVPDTCRVHEMGLYCATSLRPTLRHLREWKPDIMHAHFAMPTGLLAWTVHQITKVPYVLTAHLGDVPGGVPEQTDKLFRFIGPLAKSVWRNAAAATAVSSFVQRLAEAAYDRKVERVLNGIDLHDSNPPSAPGEIRKLVFVGRFNPQKCPDFLIDVLAGLPSDRWQATLVGDGPVMPAVRTKISKHGLADRVRLTGWLDTAQVESILRESDVFLMPSTSEGLPVAAIEALKQGLAVVASDIPGILDVVDHGANGLLLPVQDQAAWTKSLADLLQNTPELNTFKLASWQKAREFDLTHIVDQYEAILSL